MDKSDMLAKVCSYVGLNIEYFDCNAYDGKGIVCKLSGKCDDGLNRFSFTTLAFPTKDEATDSALSYLLIDSKDKNRPGAYISKLPVATSLEELELKLETLKL